MNFLSPKEFFQQSQVNNRDTLAEQCKQPPIRNAIIFALAEMTTRGGVTKEQLDGAMIYARILVNLGEPDEKLEPFPSKELKHI